jgi:type II secretory pathway pseudopilin PulG
MKKINHRKQRGFNLIEAAIVLGVVGLVIGGIWVAAAAVQSNMRESDASKQLIQMVQNIRNLYYGQTLTADATGLIDELISAGAIPKDMVASATAATDPWSGAVTVDITNDLGGSYDDIEISFAAVPKDACIEMTSRNTNISTGTGLQQIDINDGTTTTNVTSFPYLPTTAAGDCGDTNTITWYFGLRG